MKENLTQIVFILDRSGSMAGLVHDTIGGYNGFLDEQKKTDGEALLTTVLFDDKYEVLHDAVDIKEVSQLTSKEYYVRGTTALLDAIGKTINSVQNNIDNMEENNRPSKVILVITTDGYENTSREYKQPQIKTMIEHQTKGHSWEFIFLGANIDAVSTANDYGISRASNYSANQVGTDSLYKNISNTVTNFRATGDISADWNKEIK